MKESLCLNMDKKIKRILTVSSQARYSTPQHFLSLLNVIIAI